MGEGWYRRRELFTRCRGTRPFNSYGRNDNIVGGGEEWLENASSSTPACIVTLRDEFEKDNFSARFAIRREWNGRRMPRSVVADSFQTNFSRRFERERERGTTTVSTAFVPPPPPPPRWSFPCYFNWADTPPVIEVSVTRF